MLFSIIIPVFNTPKNYIIECFDSLKQQTFSNFESLLVDDGSNKETAELCDSIPLLFPEQTIKVIHQKNGGQISARYTGIDNATGDYCLFLDSDDFFKHTTIETLAIAVKKYSADMIIFNGLVYEKGKKTYPFWKHYSDVEVLLKGEQLDHLRKKVITSNRFNNICFKAIKRKVLINSDRYENISEIRAEEDYLMQLPIFDTINSALYLPVNLYYYRQTAQSAINRFHPNLYISKKRIYQERMKYGEKWHINNYQNICNCYLMKIAVEDILQLARSNTGLSVSKKNQNLAQIRTDNLFQIQYKKFYGKINQIKTRGLLYLLYHGHYKSALYIAAVFNTKIVNKLCSILHVK